MVGSAASVTRQQEKAKEVNNKTQEKPAKQQERRPERTPGESFVVYMGANVLAESFLALAKDGRYLATATHLVAQILERLRPEYYATSSATTTDAWFMSALLYALLVLRRKGKTLGMEVVGLDYDGEKSSSRRRELSLRSVGGVTLIYLCHRLARSRTQSDAADLRGSQRMQAHQRHRRAMIQRSQQHSSSSGAVIVSSTDQARDGALLMARHIPENVRKYCQRLVSAFTTSQTGGPHDLATQQIISPAWWCLRLYTAYYCINGFFPSLGHRLLGLRPAADANQNRLVNRPESHRLVALLILSHATGVVLQNLSKSVIGFLIKKRQSRSDAVRLQGQDASDSKPSGLCAICQQPRKNPACPIQCGHIFCWTCLQKWIKFRAECPVCRKASRPQDILALRNYLAPSEIHDEGSLQS